MTDSTPAVVISIVVLLIIAFVILVWYIGRRQIITRRKAIEARDRGYQIWYSRFRRRGAWRHVALFSQNHKYELRRNGDLGNITYVTKSYDENVTNDSRQQDTHVDDTENGETQVADSGRSGPFSVELGEMQDLWLFLLIGHTTKDHSEIDAICQNIGKGWRYNLVTNNCHKFTMRVAHKIVESRAPEWDIAFPQQRAAMMSQINMANQRNVMIGNMAAGSIMIGGGAGA